MDGREAEEQIRKLEVMAAELAGEPGARPSSPDEVLQLLEAAAARTRGHRSWMARLERLAWRMSAPIWDLRLRRQIRIVRELGYSIGWAEGATFDALHRLDDLVFARTYGRIVDAPVKRLVRQIAAQGAMSSYELGILVLNHCFKTDDSGVVTVPTNRWLLPLGITHFVIAGLCTLPYMLLVLLVPADLWRQLLALSVFGAPLAAAYWVFRRYFVEPHRLIPRARNLVPRLQVCQ